MKISDIQRFINNFKLLSESTPLTQIRKSVMGKGNPIRVGKEELNWFEKSQNKDRFIKLLNKILDNDTKNELKSLQSIDTDPYFEIDEETKKRCFKPQSLYNALVSKIDAIKERKIYTNSKSDKSLESQYQKLTLKNGIEVYAVYTPLANQQLTHKILKTETSPSWCIASSSANHYWSYYKLYNAEYPAVFIVARKLKTGSYDDVKYELKCNPTKTSDFKNGNLALSDFVDEWRNPLQSEKTVSETSLFKNFGIDEKYLENAIRKLMNSSKAKGFSKRYGNDMRSKFTEKISNAKNAKERRQYLIRACQNGTFGDYMNLIKNHDEKLFYIERLKEYDGLFEYYFRQMTVTPPLKDLKYLIKTKRCTNSSLQWVRHNKEITDESEKNDLMLKILESMDDEVINWYSVELFGDNKKDAIDLIVNKGKFNPELYKRLREIRGDRNCGKIYQTAIKNNKVNNMILNDMFISNRVLSQYIEDDENRVTDDTLEEAIHSMEKSNTINNETLKTLTDNDVKKEWMYDFVITYLIKNDKCDRDLISTIKEIRDKFKKYKQRDYEKYFKIIEYHIEDIIKNIIKNERLDDVIMTFVLDLKLDTLYIPALKELISTNRLSSFHELFLKCVKRDKTDVSVNYLFKYMLKNNKLSTLVLGTIIKYKKTNLFRPCVKALINKASSAQLLEMITDANDKKLFLYVLDELFKNPKTKRINLASPYFNRVQNKEYFNIFMDYVIKNQSEKIDSDYLDFYVRNYYGISNYRDYIPEMVKVMEKNGKLDGLVLKHIITQEVGNEIVKEVTHSLLRDKKYDSSLLNCLLYFEKQNLDMGVSEEDIDNCITAALEKATFNFDKQTIYKMLHHFGKREKLEELGIKYS